MTCDQPLVNETHDLLSGSFELRLMTYACAVATHAHIDGPQIIPMLILKTHDLLSGAFGLKHSHVL